MAERDQDESIFNMALAYLKRIDNLLNLCQLSAVKGDVDGWTNYLRGVYREASIKLNDDECKEIEGDPEEEIDIEKLTDALIEKEEANFRNIYFLINDQAFKIKHKRVIFFLLDALEIKIRRKMQKRGMLLPSKDDPSKAITRR